MSTFRLVYRYGHAHESNGPSREDTADEYHGDVLRSGLEDCSDRTNKSTHLDAEFPAEAIHRQTTLESANCRYGIQLSASTTAADATENVPPPENVLLIAPTIAEVGTVLK